MKRTKEQNRGITLIALVITIIVLLILAAVTISMAVNGGLFSYAEKSISETNSSIKIEQELADGKIKVNGEWFASIDDYLAGNEILYSYEETEKDEKGILKSNAIYTDTNGDTAVIPKGFAVVTTLNETTTFAVAPESNETPTVEDGLVITDELDEEGNSIGNEFVWIPVEVAETDTETSIASFYRSKWSDNARITGLHERYTEPYVSGYTNEIAEYNAMVKSVYKNRGFYIGRYEAGSTTPRTGDNDGTTEIVVKRDQYPYNYVGWGTTMSNYTDEIGNQGLGALALSKAMYANKDVGVTSTLCYGVQWDAMLDFIKDEKNVTDSETWGNQLSSVWEITRTNAKYIDYGNTDESIEGEWTSVPTTGIAKDEVIVEWISSDNSEGGFYNYVYDKKLLTTGATSQFVAKNLYDVAGNVAEWTNETYAYSYTSSNKVYVSEYRIMRGESFDPNQTSAGATTRQEIGARYTANRLGFRPCLLIK